VRKTYKAQELEAGLQRKGFSMAKRGGDKFFELWVGGKKILFTFISHGRGECGAWHVGKMAAQCKISRDEFHELIDCPMSEAEYIGVLRAKGII